MSSYYKKLTFRYQNNVYENGKLKTCIYDKTEKTEKKTEKVMMRLKMYTYQKYK